MKTKIMVALILLTSMNMLFSANYVLTVGDESYDVSLDTDTKIKVGGEYISINLTQKNILLYSTDGFSFQHPKQYSPSKTELDGDISQTVIMTPLGSVVMIQEYSSFDPTSLIDIMVSEVTKEERNYGYEIESNEKTMTLSDGKVLKGLVVTSKYKGSDIKRGFYTYGLKDSGLFIMTQIDYEIEPIGDRLIEDIFKSLIIKIK